MVQWETALLLKYEDLSSDPQHPCESLDEKVQVQETHLKVESMYTHSG